MSFDEETRKRLRLWAKYLVGSSDLPENEAQQSGLDIAAALEEIERLKANRPRETIGYNNPKEGP